MKLIIYILSLSTLLSIAILYSGCCGSNEMEPKFRVEYMRKGKIKKIYAVKNENPLADINVLRNVFSLPIDTNTTSTTYVFETENGNKILHVTYEVKFKVVECGFSVYLKSFKIGNKTTFENIVLSNPSFWPEIGIK